MAGDPNAGNFTAYALKHRAHQRWFFCGGPSLRVQDGLPGLYFTLPLLYAERARHWPGGMMGGPLPRAAVRASSRRDSRAAGEREGAGSGRGFAGDVTAQGAGG